MSFQMIPLRASTLATTTPNVFTNGFLFSGGSPPTPTHDKAVSRWAGAAWFLAGGTRTVNMVLLT